MTLCLFTLAKMKLEAGEKGTDEKRGIFRVDTIFSRIKRSGWRIQHFLLGGGGTGRWACRSIPFLYMIIVHLYMYVTVCPRSSDTINIVTYYI